MFYRIKNNKIYDYANYKYAEDCSELSSVTMESFDSDKEKFTVQNGKLVENPNYEEIKAKYRKEDFEKEFFHTSLGWVRRKVTMKDGSIKDFLSDLLLQIKAGLDIGQVVNILTYKQPNFYIEPTREYMESLQQKKPATLEFISECLNQTVLDFGM